MCDGFLDRQEFTSEQRHVLDWVEHAYGPDLRRVCEDRFQERMRAGGAKATFDPYQVFEEAYTSSICETYSKINKFAPSKFYGNVTVERES